MEENYCNGTSRPLLARWSSVGHVSSDAMEELLESEPLPCGWLARATIWESRALWILSGASIIVSIFNFMLSLSTQMFVGHLGALELAGASIANVGIQGLSYGIMLGMASAVQTVCGQSYGAKKFAAMGIICQRAIILHVAAAVGLTFLYVYTGPVLRAIGQSAEIAARGQVFAHGLIPQLYAFALNCPMQRFLQAQNIVNPLAYIAVGVFFLHLLLSWVVVFVLGQGLFGAALTLSFSWWLLVIFTAAYILVSPSCKQTWTGLSIKAFSGLWSYLKLTIASAFMLWYMHTHDWLAGAILEIWYNQGLVVISGLLPNPEISLDSISICMNYLTWDLMFMLGLSTAASIRVGNELGGRHPRVARFSVVVVVITCIIISLIFSAVVLIFQNPLSKLFTSDTAVIKAVSNLTPLLAVSVFLNGIQPILSGVAIGSGWQAIVAYVNLGTYYGIGLPIGCVLGFKTSMGVEVDKAMDRLKRSSDEDVLSLVNDTA
ncbi:Protein DETOXIFICATION 41 [Asimina triloba]